MSRSRDGSIVLRGIDSAGVSADIEIDVVAGGIKAAGFASISVESYGANPSNTYSANTTAIQAAFNAANAAGGGKVSITTPGVYKIGGTIVVYSNTEFHIGAGVTLRQETSAIRGEAGRTLFANNAYVNGVDVTISGITSSGRVCTVTTSAAHGLAVGDWVVVYGVATDGYGGVHKVTTVADTTHFTYLSHRLPTVTTAVASAYTGYTTMKTRKCDTNLTISGDGVIDYDDTNTATGLTSLHTHNIIMAAIHDLRIENISSIQSLKYNFYISGARKVLVSNVNCQGPSDGVHMTGNCFDVDVFSISTAGGDNNFAIGTIDYTGYNIFPGPNENVSVRGVGQSKGIALRVFGSAEHVHRGIRFEDVRGGNNETDIASIQIAVDALCVGSGVVNVKDIVIANSNSWTLASGQLAQLSLSGTIGKVVYRDTTMQYAGTGNGRFVVVNANAVVGDIVLENLRIDSGHSLINTTAGGTVENVFINNVRASTTYGINNAMNDAFNVFVNNSALTNSGGSFRETSSSGKMTIRFVNSTCSVYLQRSAAQTFVVDGTQMRCDASWVDRTDGVMFYNTNAALGTLGAAGIVVGQGTAANSWHLLADPTLVY